MLGRHLIIQLLSSPHGVAIAVHCDERGLDVAVDRDFGFGNGGVNFLAEGEISGAAASCEDGGERHVVGDEARASHALKQHQGVIVLTSLVITVR